MRIAVVSDIHCDISSPKGLPAVHHEESLALVHAGPRT
jgi:hypothetical protein